MQHAAGSGSDQYNVWMYRRRDSAPFSTGVHESRTYMLFAASTRIAEGVWIKGLDGDVPAGAVRNQRIRAAEPYAIRHYAPYGISAYGAMRNLRVIHVFRAIRHQCIRSHTALRAVRY